MEQSKFKKLLHRYIKGNANETENALVDAWYKSYQSKEAEVESSASDQQAIKALLFAKIKQANPNKTKNLFPFYYRIAVALAVIYTAGFWWAQKKTKSPKKEIAYNVASTNNGQLKKVILPDSSIVWLNANSKIRVNTNFESNTREVFLDEGEAFFEVTKNPERPFIVHHGKLSVKVLGTSFNVKAYSALPNLKVAVSSGKVEVKSGKNGVMLTPKQQAIYNYASKKFKTQSVNDTEASLWREGKIYLHQASFKELALTLANNFNIHLQAASATVNNYQFTLNMRTDMPEKQILEFISAIHNSNYRKEGNKVILY